MQCFCGRPALDNGLCIYHDDSCVKDPRCRKKLVFAIDCELCHLPGGEVSGAQPRLRGAKIHGPLLIESVAGDIDLREARGRDLIVYNVRGGVLLTSSRFTHVYVDLVLGEVAFSQGRAQSFVASRVEGRVDLSKAVMRGHVLIYDTKGVIDIRGAAIAGEFIIDRHKGGVSLGARAYSITIARVKGDVDISGAEVEGDIYVLESEGDRLDLSGVEVGGRVYILESSFSGVRVDKAEVLKKIFYAR